MRNKKSIIIMVLLLIVSSLFVMAPTIVSDPLKYALSPSEYKRYLLQAEEGNEHAIETLLNYFLSYRRDMNAGWMIVCYGAERKIPGYIELKNEIFENQGKCPEKPLTRVAYQWSLPWWWFYR